MDRALRAACPDQEHSGIGRLTWIRSLQIALPRGGASEARGACVTEGTGNREQGTVCVFFLFPVPYYLFPSYPHSAVPAGRNTTYKEIQCNK
ncbi:MAG: hypothetical protein ACLQOO_14355 [Terriglobia bacterium]